MADLFDSRTVLTSVRNFGSALTFPDTEGFNFSRKKVGKRKTKGEKIIITKKAVRFFLLVRFSLFPLFSFEKHARVAAGSSSSLLRFFPSPSCRQRTRGKEARKSQKGKKRKLYERQVAFARCLLEAGEKVPFASKRKKQTQKCHRVPHLLLHFPALRSATMV